MIADERPIWAQLVQATATVAVLVFAAILLVHLFATPELGVVDLLGHALVIGSTYVLGFAVAYGVMLCLWARTHARRPAHAAALALTTAAGLLIGLGILTAARELLPLASGGHTENDWVARLMPVGAVLTLLYLLSERMRGLRARLAELSEYTDRHPSVQNRGIELRGSNGLVIVNAPDIAMVAAQENYCDVLLVSGKRILVRRTLAAMLRQLGECDFAQSHRSFLVNLSLIERVVPDGRAFRVHLSGVDESVPASRRHVEDLAEAWRRFRESPRPS
jgi:hypothetical protein